MDGVVTTIATLGLVGAGVTAGTLFAFSNFIMDALRQAPGGEGMRSMQAINRSVFNPWFMGGFFGTTLLSIGAIVLGVLSIDRAWGIAFISGGCLYALGVFLVTGVRNVPLNNTLERADADDESGAALWRRYLIVWTRWNHVRVVCATLAMLHFAYVLWIL